jgi:hypothetical protein
MVYFIAAALTSAKVAIIPSLVVTLWLAAVEYYGYAVFPALLCSLVAVYALLRYISTWRIRWVIVSGVGVAGAILFRHDIGLYSLACISLVLCLTPWVGPARGALTWRGAVGMLVAVESVLLASTIVPLLPLTLYLVQVVPLDELWSSLVLYPIRLNRDISYLPYPPLIPDYLPLFSDPASVHEYVRDLVEPWMRFYVPLLVYGLSGIAVPRAWSRVARPGGRVVAVGMALLFLFGMTLFNHALIRFDRIHALPTAIPAVILLTALLYRGACPGGTRRYAFLWGLLLVPAVAFYVVQPVRLYALTVTAFPPWICHAHLPRSGCADLYPDQEQAIAYIRAHTAAEERIFVGLTRHDRVSGSDVMFYFLADRHSATRYHELIAGVATTAEVQREIVQDLERLAVRHVVLSDAFEDALEPNASRLSSGVVILDEFIRGQYTPVARFTAYTIWQRAASDSGGPG